MSAYSDYQPFGQDEGQGQGQNRFMEKLQEPVSKQPQMQQQAGQMQQQQQLPKQHLPYQQMQGPQMQAPQLQQPQQPQQPQQQQQKNVQLPPNGSGNGNGVKGDSNLADVSEYDQVTDWVYLILSVVIVELIVITLARCFPDYLGKWVNVWYNRFNLLAVLSDILIILIGFTLTRYIYTEYVYNEHDWNPMYFTGVAVGVQLIHDLFLYFAVIKQVPEGSNEIIDVFKGYVSENGWKILPSDSLMVIGTSLGAMLLKNFASPASLVSIGLVSSYLIPYALSLRNEYSLVV